ncbi:MAG: DUF5333 domain-containing protein [Rhodobacter sp.]|uniref:DUF5333 domain-containing protein n=1 Tax=Pararhodobacter sp. TaxID=2127056 RepID=UPI001DCD02D1|nr:DUF5333 domain-containing protein [Pararhodobacter sp.]MCB1408260.1 DUF5333 domain-containing protein [Paracoccaceae bacterium]MCC0073847.1 DUF5333 domain-containing protein [Rhodobacter sp.]HPD94032.1 DUF5333 domain-containing protein [Pararhodobacter sp.]
MKRLLLIPLFALALAAPVQAATQEEINATLAGDPQVWGGLYTLALADQIRANCPAIEARTLRATSFVWSVYNRARDHGYSRAEIRAFQTHATTEARLRAEIGAYFARHGVREGQPDTYCALGHAEIAAGTEAGELLRAR